MTSEPTSTYWFYVLPGAVYAYDLHFREPKTIDQVRTYLADHWNTTEDTILSLWPGS